MGAKGRPKAANIGPCARVCEEAITIKPIEVEVRNSDFDVPVQRHELSVDDRIHGRAVIGPDDEANRFVLGGVTPENGAIGSEGSSLYSVRKNRCPLYGIIYDGWDGLSRRIFFCTATRC
jgi:hypothetical protein